MKPEYINAWEKYLKGLLVVTMSFIVSKYIVDAMHASIDPWIKGPAHRWFVAFLLVIGVMSTLLLICYIDPSDP